MKPSYRSIDNFQSNISNSRSNIEHATNFQSNKNATRSDSTGIYKNLQLTVQRPRILESFNENLSENKDDTREINNFKNATRGDSRQIFPKCDVSTNNGTQCLNPGNLSVNNKNSCNNYCMSHSDAWINSMTTNPYIVSDTSGNIVNSDLVYDISVKTVGKSINQYLPSVTDINGKYKIDFKINGHLNLPTTDNKSNELVDEFLQNENVSDNKSNELVDEFLQNNYIENKQSNTDVPEEYKTTPEYLKAVKKIQEWINKNDNSIAIILSDLNLKYLPEIPENCNILNISNNNLIRLPKLPNNLESLLCSNNKLLKLDVSYLNNLKKLYCTNNNLETLKINKILNKLICDNNKLKYLPILPDTLEELICAYNEIIELPELPNNLKILSCRDNNLINLPKLPNSLVEIHIKNNYLTSLINLPEKTQIYIDCIIKQIDGKIYTYNQKPLHSRIINDSKKENINLVNEFAENKQFGNKLVEEFTENNQSNTDVPEYYKTTPEYLEAVRLIKEWKKDTPEKSLNLSELNLQYCPPIPENCKKLNLNNNNLKLLPNLPHSLENLYIANNKIKDINSNELPKNLKTLNLNNNNLTNLDISNLNFLKTLDCYKNNLNSLKLNENLNYLDCAHNNLTYLKFPKNLQTVVFYKNKFKVFDNSFFNINLIQKDINIQFDEVYMTQQQVDLIKKNNRLIVSIKGIISNSEYNTLLNEAQNINEFKTNNLVDEFTKSTTDKWADEFLNKPLLNESTIITLTDLTTNKSINITSNDLEYLDYTEFLKWCLNPRNAQLQSISKHLTNYNTKLNVKNKINNKDVSTEWKAGRGKKIIYTNMPQIKSRM